jgi:hypothetical protein
MGDEDMNRDLEKRADACRALLLQNGDPDSGDTPVFTEFAQLFTYDAASKTRNSLGWGMVRIMRNSKRKRYRVIMRSEDCKKVLVDHYIVSDLYLGRNFVLWSVVNFGTDMAETLGSADGVAVNLMYEFSSEAVTQDFAKHCRQALAKNGELLKRFGS